MDLKNTQKLDLSFSKIHAYRQCPWLYHLVTVQGWRVGPNRRQALGTSIHRALAAYLSEDNVEKSENRLYEIFNEVWVNEGFKNTEETFSFYEEGRHFLSNFFNIEKTNKNITLGTEKDFRIEWDSLIFQGTVDRIDRSPSGDIILIEYKTFANRWGPKKIQSDLQMTCYKIGLAEGLGLNPTSCRYYFLSSGDVIETERTNEQIKEAKTLITDTAQSIQFGNFIPNTQHCHRCDFQSRCTKAVV